MRSHEQPIRLNTYGMGVMLAALMVVSMACPVVDDSQTQYDLGYAAGFLQDNWYWDGYDDGYDTTAATPIYYDDSGIPYYDELSYNAGYWDGVWYAYNDGYFVDYHYAFLLGFSEGYDNAYWPDYLDFLATDQHTEYGHGGWVDGYNDGYSEGRVFGANDYEQGLTFDWLDALYDYESGTDLYFQEINVGTGAWGPVVLYEYGVNPTAKALVSKPTRRDIRGNVRGGVEKALDADMYRALTQEVSDQLDVKPAESIRDDRALRLETTWLERVDAYLGGTKTLSHGWRARTAPSF